MTENRRALILKSVCMIVLIYIPSLAHRGKRDVYLYVRRYVVMK